MTDPWSVIEGLPSLKWRGSTHSHYSDISFPFGHRQNRIEWPYVDAAGHENTGRVAKVTPITLLFYNTLYSGAFPNHFNEWWSLLSDGKSGKLEHPIAGNYDAVVTGGNVRITAQDRAGAAVEINFEEHVDDPAAKQSEFFVNIPDLATVAQAADAATSAIGIDTPEEAFALSLEEMARAIQSAIFLAQLNVLALINKAKAVAQLMTETAIAINSFVATGAIDALTAFWSALDFTAKSLGNKARKQAGFLVVNPTTLDAFARSFGMSLDEAIELNPGAASSPGVPTGTLLRYYS